MYTNIFVFFFVRIFSPSPRPDNELYSGTVADFSGSDPIIYRETLQTEQYDSLSLNGNEMFVCVCGSHAMRFNFALVDNLSSRHRRTPSPRDRTPNAGFMRARGAKYRRQQCRR